MRNRMLNNNMVVTHAIATSLHTNIDTANVAIMNDEFRRKQTYADFIYYIEHDLDNIKYSSHATKLAEMPF